MVSERAQWITTASRELKYCGLVFEDLAGIDWVEDEDGNPHPARHLTEDETWYFTVEKLRDDGRLFQAFEDTDEGRRHFVAAADPYGLREAAETLVRRVVVPHPETDDQDPAVGMA